MSSEYFTEAFLACFVLCKLKTNGNYTRTQYDQNNGQKVQNKMKHVGLKQALITFSMTC